MLGNREDAARYRAVADLEKVHEQDRTSEKTTIVVAPTGRQNASDVRLLRRREGPFQDHEARTIDGRLHVGRKERRHDEWDPPIPVYEPYGPGSPNDFDVIAEA